MMGDWKVLVCLVLARTPKTASSLRVELKEIVNPALASVQGSGSETTCSPEGCTGILTRDGDYSPGSRYSCIQPAASSSGDDDFPFEDASCDVTYRLYEASSSSREAVALSSVHVAFAPDSKTTLRVLLDGDVVVASWKGEEGSTAVQEIPGLEGYEAQELTIEAILEEGEWVGITETEIYIDVDGVPVSGVSASETSVILATATVNDAAAGITLDGDTAKQRAWCCATGDLCQIEYDLGSVRSMEQISVAFVGRSSTAGATINVYTAGVDNAFSAALTGVSAGVRDPSTATEDLQTFGGVRALAQYVKVEGVVGTGGMVCISEVDIRISEDTPSYPTVANPKWVPVGSTPLGSSPFGGGVAYHQQPESEGGCSAGRLDGCGIFNIKDGDNSVGSRWSCGPQLGTTSSSPCAARFDLNGNRYIRQIQLAFYKGDERHTEFSVLVEQNDGIVELIPSAISSGKTVGFQTWDLQAYASAVQIRPKFGDVKDWMSVKEMVILEKAYTASAMPVMRYSNFADGFDSDLPVSALKKKFSFDLDEVGDTGTLRFVVRGGQTASISAIRLRFPTGRAFVFDVTWRNESFDTVSQRFASAGGAKTWETFSLDEPIDLSVLSIVAVEGPDESDYPAFRAADCRVIGSLNDSGSKWVVSTMIDYWGVIPDYIGDGTGDQEDLNVATCAAIGQGFDGSGCNGAVSGTSPATEVNMIAGTFYVDGPVFLESGVDLIGQFFLDDGELTELEVYGAGTGFDGIIYADDVSGVKVSEVELTSNVAPGSGSSGVFGDVCVDVNNSEDVTFDEVYLRGCPTAGARFVDSESITLDYGFGSGAVDGNMMILRGVTDYLLSRTAVKGMLIEDCTNVVIEVGGDDEFGDPVGDIRPPDGGEQSANLVVTGDSSGVVLKGIDIFPGAEPRILLASPSPLTLDGVIFPDAEAGECLVQVPQGSGEAAIVQLNVVTPLELSGDSSCFVLA